MQIKLGEFVIVTRREIDVKLNGGEDVVHPGSLCERETGSTLFLMRLDTESWYQFNEKYPAFINDKIFILCYYFKNILQ